MSQLRVAIIAIPIIAAILALVLPSRIARVLTAIAGVATAACILGLVTETADGHSVLDALSALFLIPVGVVYGTVGIYSTWYVRAESIGADGDERYRREFLALTNAFACAEVVVPSAHQHGRSLGRS